MFHWICPECGREIPPSVRECQACDPHAPPPRVVEPVESTQVAEPVSAPPLPETVVLPAPAPPLLLEAALAAEPEIDDLEITQEFPIRTLAEPVAEIQPVILEPVVEIEPVAEELPAVADAPVLIEAAATEQVIEQPVLEASELVADVPPPVEAVPVLAGATPAVAPEAQEIPIKLQDVPDPLLALAEEIRAAQAARAAALAALAEPPPSNGLLGLAEAVGQSQSVEPISQPDHAEAVSRQVEPAAPIEQVHAAESTTAVALLAPPLIAAEPVSFHELRPVALAPEPQPQPAAEPEPFNQPEHPAEPVALAPEPQPEPDGPTLPLAPMQDYKAATSRSIQPVAPRPQILAADAGPRITLPGPTLPPELTRLQDANVLTVIGENTAQRTKEAIPPAKSAGAPGWLVSTFVMLLLLAAGLGVVFYLLPHTVADAKPAPTPAVAATSPVPTGGNSPLAKFIEVTGFRIVTSSPDANKKEAAKKSEVQYLVVNHSDADISDANIFVTLRSAKPGQAPVCRFSFKVPSLGPFESKEMSSPIGNSTRAISLPDWQEIRAEVQISQ
jgi:hypothetical protein